MKKNFLLFIIVILSVFFINGCVSKNVDTNKDNQNTQENNRAKNDEIINEIQNNPVNQIGGQRDEHNCLGPAGYSWDEEIGACTRNWEITDDLKQPAKIAIESLDKGSFTVIEVLKMDCEGCFTVKLQNNNEEDSEKQFSTIELKDWKVIN